MRRKLVKCSAICAVMAGLIVPPILPPYIEAEVPAVIEVEPESDFKEITVQLEGSSFPIAIQKHLYGLCEEYGIRYELALAVVEIESGYDPDCTSSCDARGYMQVIGKWHKDRMERLGVKDLYDPYGNLTVGVDYLSELINKYGDEEKALVCYNQGSLKGKTSTPYSRAIIKRAEEIKSTLSA